MHEPFLATPDLRLDCSGKGLDNRKQALDIVIGRQSVSVVSNYSSPT